jgi:hypothetical protein
MALLFRGNEGKLRDFTYCAHLKIEKSRCSIAIWLARVKIQIDSEGLQWCRKAEDGGSRTRDP